MKITCKIAGFSRDIVTNKVMLTLEVLPGSGDLSGMQKLIPCEKLDVDIAKPKKMKSKSANAYFHALVGEIAPILRISRQRCKNMLISRYGQPVLLEDGSPLIYATNAPEDYMAEKETVHSNPVGMDDEGRTMYAIYRGVHDYDSVEMSKLLEGTIAEAIELGIETIAGDRLADIKAAAEAYAAEHPDEVGGKGSLT